MSTPKIEPLCQNCAFHGGDMYQIWWVCRRNPPVAPANSPNDLACYPSIDLDGWCGEFRPGSGGVVK